jgi:hypothetical protein
MTAPDPRALLDAARALLAAPPPSLRRSWPRACAALTRLALERALRGFWQRRARCLVGRPMRHQLLALPVLADRDTAALATSAWHGLSRAMHHHTYELPATAGELLGWTCAEPGWEQVADKALDWALAQAR